jgi:integrase/recombinase XerD
MATAKSLTQIEITQILSNIKNYPNAIRNRAMFLFTVLAGLRVSEVAGLTIADVRKADDSIKSEIFLSADRVKHHHARTIFVSTRLQAELAEYIDTKVFLFDAQPLFSTNRGIRHAFSANTLTQHFHYLYKRSGISSGSSHSGRKTFITSLASQGISVFVLASLAGHKSISTTQRYVSVNDEMKRRAVELV